MRLLLIFTIKLIVFAACIHCSPSNSDSVVIESTDPPDQETTVESSSTESNETLRLTPAARSAKVRYEENTGSGVENGRFKGYGHRNPSPGSYRVVNDPRKQLPLRNLTTFQDKALSTETNEAKGISVDSNVSSDSRDGDGSRDYGVQQPSITGQESQSDLNFMAEVINDFGFKLEKSLFRNTNFFISSFSIFVAMAMTYLGSGGTTKKQMEDVLGLDLHAIHDDRFHENMAHLIRSLSKQNGKVLLEVANGVFISTKFNVKQQYKKDLQEFYAASLQNINYQDGDSTVRTINQWVEKSTKSMIKDFLKSPPNPITRLLLLNAVYFKGAWKTKFPQERTFDGEFYLINGTITKARLMILYKEKFPYLYDENLGYSFVKLPYDGDSISMIIALPSVLKQEPNLQMTHKLLCDIQDKMIVRRLENLIVPKFNFDYSRALKDSLKALGMRDLFDGYTADLTGIRDEKDLFVSNILHKAIIEVNEEGTAAAAVTQVSIRMLSVSSEPDFIANHPFAFYIVDEKSGVILFQGKVYNPSGSSSGERQTTKHRGTRVKNNSTILTRSDLRNALQFMYNQYGVRQRFRVLK